VLTLVWHENARADVRMAVEYIAERNSAAAERFEAAIGECVERLPRHPLMHRAGRVPGTREAVITPNHVLVYRITAELVEILSLLHTRRQYP
jgi:toxin ParE1/3/4